MAYAEKRAANPGALGLTIGLNAAAVLALALWNPNIIKEIGTTITTINIDPIADPPPPPPPQTDPKPQPKTKIDQVDPKVLSGGTTETSLWRDPGPGPTIVVKDPGPGPIVEPPPLPPVHNIIRSVPMMATREGELQPPYPPSLQRQGIEGSVTVRILVGTDGRPKDIVLVRADDPDFFAAAKAWGMRHWRFKPAGEDGTAIEGWYTLTVKFNIE